MVSQMVCFPSSMVLPELGQSFTIGSMTSLVDANGIGEIVEVVQNQPASIVPTSTTTSLTSVPRRWARRSIDQDNLIVSIDQVIDFLVECLSLVDSVLDWSTMSDEVPTL